MPGVLQNMKTHAYAVLVAGLFLPFGGLAALADDKSGESEYLGKFEGSWVGTGSVRLVAGAPMVAVNCTLAGTAVGQKLELKGKCGGGLVSTSVHASMQFDAQKGAYVGSWRTTGSNAGLSGQRHGSSFSLSVNEAGEPNRLLTLGVSDGQLRFTMRRLDDRARVMQVAFSKN